MKKLFALIVALLVCLPAVSRPAWRGLVKAVQPDGSVILLRLHGDEFCHWSTNTAGQVVEKDTDGYWRPVKDTGALELRRAVAASRRSAQMSAMKKAPKNVAIGKQHYLVILVEFTDVKFSNETANQDFHDMMNKVGYDYNGATGSTRDYYYENSHGVFEPVFDVYGPVTMTHEEAYYGKNADGFDQNPNVAVRDGCKALDDQIDFSLYDNDKDGYVDLVYMYYAGYSEAEGADSDTIWPHQWDLESAGTSITCDGKKISRYACSSELEGSGVTVGKISGIGAACHEFGHTLGLPDFYDTDYEDNGQAAGMIDYSLMAGGSYNNQSRTPPFFTFEERIILGWVDESDYREFSHSGQVELTTVDDNKAYRTFTDTEGEYFVYECRGNNRWDAYVPAPGLLVTHVDKSSRNVDVVTASGTPGRYTAKYLWDTSPITNCLNENGSHPCCYIVASADQSNLLFGYKYYQGYGYYFDDSNGPYIPFPGKSNITTYAAESWNGVVSDITLSSIAYADNKVSFNVFVPSEDLDYTVIDNPGNGVYAVGDLFEFKLLESGASPVSSVTWYYDDEPVSDASVRLKAGRHTVEAVLTLTSGESQTVTLEISVE